MRLFFRPFKLEKPFTTQGGRRAQVAHGDLADDSGAGEVRLLILHPEEIGVSLQLGRWVELNPARWKEVDPEKEGGREVRKYASRLAGKPGSEQRPLAREVEAKQASELNHLCGPRRPSGAPAPAPVKPSRPDDQRDLDDPEDLGDLEALVNELNGQVADLREEVRQIKAALLSALRGLE